MHERLPSRDGLHDLKDTISLLPDAVTRSGAGSVRVHGGAHLSVAFAVGTALPSSRIGDMEVVDQRGHTWASGSEARFSSPPQLEITAEGTDTSPTTTGRQEVAVYLDLLPQRSDAAFHRYLDENAHRLAAWCHLISTHADLLDPAAAGAIAADAAAYVRAISNDNANAAVHLLLRCPFPLALLLGRLTNTLRFVVYEWDDSDAGLGGDHRARYVPVLRIRTSASEGVIDEVLLDATN